MEKKLKRQKGFTLLEVIVAFSIFALFATVFLQNQSQNVFDSREMNGEMILKSLCESKMNETLVNLPDFDNALDGKKETKTFKRKGFEDYSYTLEFKRFKAPDIEALFTPQTDEEQTAEQKAQQQTLKAVFKEVKKKIESVHWEIRVTVINKLDKRTYILSTWFTDPKAKFDLNIPILNAGSTTNSDNQQGGL